MTEGINGGKNLKIGNQESCREAVSCIWPKAQFSRFMPFLKICYDYQMVSYFSKVLLNSRCTVQAPIFQQQNVKGIIGRFFFQTLLTSKYIRPRFQSGALLDHEYKQPTRPTPVVCWKFLYRLTVELQTNTIQVLDLERERNASAIDIFDGGLFRIGDTQITLVRQPEFNHPVGLMRHREREHISVENNRRQPVPAVQNRIGSAYFIFQHQCNGEQPLQET